MVVSMQLTCPSTFPVPAWNYAGFGRSHQWIPITSSFKPTTNIPTATINIRFKINPDLAKFLCGSNERPAIPNTIPTNGIAAMKRGFISKTTNWTPLQLAIINAQVAISERYENRPNQHVGFFGG